MSPGFLYISYDGMLEPLGQSQVLAYLERLAPGRRIHLISFEKSEDWSDLARREAVRERISGAGIHWHPLRYHKSPSAPATAFDICHGIVRAAALVRRHRLSIIHARSYVAALIGLAAKRLTGAKLLFDMRGLWADERVEGRIWPAGSRLFKLAKQLERKFLAGADHVVTLTHASVPEIHRLAGRDVPISVIPTCADLDKFRPPSSSVESGFVLGYVGSVGTWYLLDEMLRSFQFLSEIEPGARLLFVNRNEHDLIRERATALGIEPKSLEVVASDHRDVARHVGRMDAAMAIYRPLYSKVATAPTKLGEYLGCGVPCLGNRGVGDVADILEGRRVGVALGGFSDDELRSGVTRLLELSRESGLASRCRDVAEDLFSLEAGADRYAGIYESLGGMS